VVVATKRSPRTVRESLNQWTGMVSFVMLTKRRKVCLSSVQKRSSSLIIFVELWNIFHNELDLDGNGHLDADEWAAALHKSGIELTPETLNEFITSLTSSPHSRTVSFPEFRDFLLLMPRKASTAEIYRYYEVTKFDLDARGASRINMEGVQCSYGDLPSNISLSHRGRQFKCGGHALDSASQATRKGFRPACCHISSARSSRNRIILQPIPSDRRY
jgi:hypothetical protein